MVALLKALVAVSEALLPDARCLVSVALLVEVAERCSLVALLLVAVECFVVLEVDVLVFVGVADVVTFFAFTVMKRAVDVFVGLTAHAVGLQRHAFTIVGMSEKCVGDIIFS